MGRASGRAGREERLRKIIRELQRHRFGRRAESLPLDQLQLGLEEAEQAEAVDEALAEAAAPTVHAARTAKRRANRGFLPAHLPRIETVVDIADDSCPCCSAPLHPIGEDVSERLDVMPAQFRVLAVRRPKYACWACTDGVAQAPALARLIEGGLPTDATVRRCSCPNTRRPAAVQAGADLRPAGCHHRPLHPGRLGWARRGSARARARTAARSPEGVDEAVRRRDHGAGARPWPRAHEDGGSCGPTRATIVPGAAPTRQAWLTSMLPTVRASGPRLILPASPACCRWTATKAIAP